MSLRVGVCLIAGLLIVGFAAAQQLEEVVYLKNGSIIRGIILEQVPGKSVRIQTRDGSVFVYSMEEVERITKEPSLVTSTAASDVYATDKSYVGVNPLGFIVGGLSWVTFERHLGGGFTYQARVDVVTYTYEERDGTYSYDEKGTGFGGGFTLKGYTLGSQPYSGLFGAFGVDVVYTKWEWTEVDVQTYTGSGSTTTFVFSTQIGYTLALSNVRIEPSFIVGYFLLEESNRGISGIGFAPGLQIGIVF